MPPGQNRLLEELPERTFRSVRTASELVELKLGDVLSEPGERIRYVYFPTQSVVSLIAKVSGNATLEVALIGNEGMVGLPIPFGTDAEPLLAVVQKSGEAWRMQVETFKRKTNETLSLRRVCQKSCV